MEEFKLRTKNQEFQKKEYSNMIEKLNLRVSDSNKQRLEELQIVQNDNKQLLTKLNNIEKQNKKLEDKCLKYQQEKNQAEATKRLLINESNRRKIDNIQLKGEVTRLENCKTTLDLNFKVLDSINRQLLRDNAIFESQCNTYENIIEELEETNGELINENDNQRCKLNDQDISSLQNFSNQLLGNISCLEEELHNKNKTVEGYISKLENQKKEISSLKSLYSGEVGKLKADLVKERETCDLFINRTSRYVEIIKVLAMKIEDLKKLREKDQKDNMNQIIKCKVCFEEPITHSFSPCNHFVTCENCSINGSNNASSKSVRGNSVKMYIIN
ncbi:7781_t:CDS:2 [Entrophospora sp. SA101]|nr:3426_t:CDS:2 [Entrophospora sp. SA101]CAJ0829695.1 7781_t:CDS:2 [Entrophospora sp. SA101]CAJ0840155.1 775_t:CDS:2 [Entrophospora sp. SA101]CAJ0919011.1 11391_t:CDS:2 [Entrophospora sp. SA101]